MHYGPVPSQSEVTWTFTIDGATADGDAHVFSMADLLALPTVSEVADMHCATHWTAVDQQWSGVRAADVLALAPPAADAPVALVYAEFGYAANVPVVDLQASTSLLATQCGGEPLTAERGAPMRLVIPHLYTWKGPKWVRGWSYLRDGDAAQGFWEKRGYHQRGAVWQGERYAYQD